MLHQGLPGKHHHYRQRDYPFKGTCGGSILRSTVEAVPHFQSEWTIGGFYALRLEAYLRREHSGGAGKSGALSALERTEPCRKHLPGYFEDIARSPTSPDFAAAGKNGSIWERNDSGVGPRGIVPDQRRVRARLLCRDHSREKRARAFTPRRAWQCILCLSCAPGSDGAL